ncbi:MULTISPECIES: FAD-dependent monooxygenase [unclassified Streptomyces]|uniref:FAD-dependent monooxygenase n=1 Tax=unclassified Streptomyces TaxID=2593676 RepID=UPI0022557F6D|nr:MULTISPECIES: FAD-dependent monooxygenase [unclassified Streptomyces]MCX4641996.1 FAD-dependent monooxygenase [Streptomyces sp. NBC_01446]MCX5085728.1 FAD-dependent monooxygenase [Streptomyces sp. NBC_00401]MCX5326869.1 FAD-dependent monooxygenase [Streptomyces sp. NBC_00120]
MYVTERAPRSGPRIAIVGGGIGGLAAAAFLRRAGLTATVYEQASALTEVGAGIVLAPNAARLLRRLGVLEPALRRAVPLDWGWEFRRWEDGRVLSVEQLTGVCEELYGERTYTIHRADLLDAIKSAVPAEQIRLGARCTAVEEKAAGLRLRFADGATADADVVIGADGVHSVVRGLVAEPQPPAYSGVCAFRAVVPVGAAPEFALRRAQTLWIGPGRHFVHYPIVGGQAVNVVAFTPAGDYTDESWSATASVEEFAAEFKGWDPRVTDLIAAGDVPGRWALLDRAPLPHWSRGTVTLLGDAAHPMFPFFAQGAAQSLEDAVVLAHCLAAAPDEPENALAGYEAVRIARTTRLQEISHGRSDVNHLPDGPEQQARDAALAEADPLVANGWIYGHDAEQLPVA